MVEKSAISHEEAVKLMQAVDSKVEDKFLQAGFDYLRQPGRKLAAIGFSRGGQESLIANLNDSDAVSATVMIYGVGFDKIDTMRLERLKNPVLVITGAEDTGGNPAAINFLSTMKEAKGPYEMLIYPGVDPFNYAQVEHR